MPGAGVGEHELNYTATIRDPPTLQPEFFSLYEEEPGGVRPGSRALAAVRGRPRGGRPEAFAELRPQERVQRDTVEQLANFAPMVQILDALVPQMGDQLVEVLKIKSYDTPIPEQVIEVPKISSSSSRSRRVLRAPQTAEQFVDVPTVVSFSSLQQQRAEQIIDIPVLHRHRGGGGGLQGFLPEQNTLTFLFRMVFNVYAQVRFLLLHPLTHLVLRMRLLQGVFELFPK